MEVTTMRAILKKQYNGAFKWINRVNSMSDNQIIAIYFRMLRAGQLKQARY